MTNRGSQRGWNSRKKDDGRIGAKQIVQTKRPRSLGDKSGNLKGCLRGTQAPQKNQKLRNHFQVVLRAKGRRSPKEGGGGGRDNPREGERGERSRGQRRGKVKRLTCNRSKLDGVG